MDFDCRLIRLDGNKGFAFYSVIAVRDHVFASFCCICFACNSDIPKINRFTIPICCAIEVVLGCPIFPCVQLAIVNFNCGLIRFDGDKGFAFYVMIAVSDLVFASFSCICFACNSDIPKFNRFTIPIRCAVKVALGFPLFPCVQLAIVNFNCGLIGFDGNKGFAFYTMIAVNDLVLACLRCIDSSCNSDIPKINRFTISIRCTIEIIHSFPVFPCVQLAIVNFNCRLIGFNGDNGFAFYPIITIHDLIGPRFIGIDASVNAHIGKSNWMVVPIDGLVEVIFWEPIFADVQRRIVNSNRSESRFDEDRCFFAYIV